MFQLSLRGLLVFTALCALAIVSLRWASTGWCSVVLTATLIAFWGAAIIAAVDRGSRQAFAIGYVLSTMIYAAALLLAGVLGEATYNNVEFNPATGRLPTTRLLEPLFLAIADIRWIDFRSGQEVTDFDRSVIGRGPGSQFLTQGEVPARETFMIIGHCWWALLLGYCGGWIARFVYLRRNREQSSLASGRS